MPEGERIYIGDAAAAVNRPIVLLEKWEQLGLLPDDISPQHDGFGSYWISEQLVVFRNWLRESDREKVYIRHAAAAVGRRMSTLRKWEQLDLLPEHLMPHRGHRDWRYWTLDQVEGMREWLRETDRRPGKGLPHYNPTEQQLDKAIKAMRRPHQRATTSVPSTSGGIVDL